MRSARARRTSGLGIVGTVRVQMIIRWSSDVENSPRTGATGKSSDSLIRRSLRLAGQPRRLSLRKSRRSLQQLCSHGGLALLVQLHDLVENALSHFPLGGLGDF